jgi:hypothetical protein
MKNTAPNPDLIWEYHKCFQLCYQAKTKLEEALATIAEYDEMNPSADEIISRLLEEAALTALSARPQQWELKSDVIEPMAPVEPEEEYSLDDLL